uniref:RRM domain-containing protein n=3 Tax=Aureoumbra lagunensis TaxID=44058 RepID=A0A7S3K4M4_9STRA|mmetsp:Transcript_12460/g.16771  ORF Transcript_12460/g.16771 Transcript_12460/m.16771 type:complete len:146 (+) Transcript_12460:1060-1497(+)
MDASSRAALMQQLGKRAGISEVQQAFARHEPSTSTTINKVAPLIGPPLAAICISNMFDPAKETDPNWRDDIREDVTLECEKFGKVIHIHVDAISTRGLVHILFDSNLSAQKAAAALHGRYFAGRPISLTYVDPKTHRMQFADEIN